MFRTAVSVLAILGYAFAQTVAITPRARLEAVNVGRSTFRSDARMVQIPVTVTDALDKPVLGLPPASFRIFEDDVEQRIVNVSMADGPLSAGILFDSSGSMRTRIEESRVALREFLGTADPQDEFFLIRFSDQPELLTPFTRDPDRVSQSLGLVKPHGWTALYDAMFWSFQQMRRASNPRRAVLLLSDGEDNNSRYTETEVLSRLREADVRVYAIGLFRKVHCLEKMAEETGGRLIWVHQLSDLSDAVQKLSREMRNQYVLNFFSNNARSDGKYRTIKVQVQGPEGQRLRLSWRRGYYAAGD